MSESTPFDLSPSLTAFVDPKSINQRNAKAAAKIYRALKPRQMRLIMLHRGTGRLRCSLLIVSDDPQPEYEALSYVWGSQTDLKTIYLNDKRYFVTTNLFDTLQMLRSRDKDRILWIDALVINQSDLKERATEIAKMSAIFSRAVKTLVWLGQGNSEIERHMINLANLNVEKANLTSNPGGIGVPIRLDVVSILGVTYWDRAWVVQELMYSDEVLLFYGLCSLPWDHFIKIVDKGLNPLWLGYSDLAWGDPKLAIRPGSGRRKEYLRLPIWLESYCCLRDCTESRDHVFAYHGCFPPFVRDRIRLAYNMSLEQIAMDVTLAWIDSERNLDFLSQVGRRGKWISKQQVPTWIPNYFGTRASINSLTDYSETPRQTTAPPVFRFLDGNSVLEVKGVWLGAINSTGTQPTGSGSFQVEGLDTYLLEQLSHSQGLINNLEPDFRELIHMSFNREDLLSKFGEDSHIVKNISASYDFTRGGIEVYNVGQLIHIVSNHTRISFRFNPVEASRSIQMGKASIPFGFGTSELKVGDQLCVVVGCRLALILRNVGKKYMVVGNAYVFGFHSGLDLHNKFSEYPPSVIDTIELC
ncbi:uncharacterized protein PAC_12668 [Phialocephala subalpina]|uniref:Heterokaryon incompatibility domain-containing protein n=1 Tax=Phialocephala subalpina TaxID=576137 RepID=A0A1L7XCL0_9HELO|nr:uncharacterized protein PAC_12668 [Phialocephala subalpina]